jgi:hypothetical protein
MCEDFAAKFGCLWHHDNEHISPGMFFGKQHDCHPHPSFRLGFPLRIFSFPLLQIKFRGHYFDTVEVIETESQVMLNTLTEDVIQDAYTQTAEALGTAHTSGRALFGGCCDQNSQASF